MEQVLKGFTLDFFGSGKHKTSPEKFFDEKDAILLDVRSKEEAASLSINLAYHSNIQCINIPVNEIPDKLDEIPAGKHIGVFCSGVVRSAIVYAYLLTKGFLDARILAGGYPALTEALKPGKILKAIQNEK